MNAARFTHDELVARAARWLKSYEGMYPQEEGQTGSKALYGLLRIDRQGNIYGFRRVKECTA